jgi:hypothetical protein
LVAVLALGACTAGEPTAPQPTITVKGANTAGDATLDLDSFEVNGDERADTSESDPCGLAALLPPDNMCSLICSPDELAARMLESGMHHNVCYQLRCALTAEINVSVGVCL